MVLPTPKTLRGPPGCSQAARAPETVTHPQGQRDLPYGTGPTEPWEVGSAAGGCGGRAAGTRRVLRPRARVVARPLDLLRERAIARCRRHQRKHDQQVVRED